MTKRSKELFPDEPVRRDADIDDECDAVSELGDEEHKESSVGNNCIDNAGDSRLPWRCIRCQLVRSGSLHSVL
jgi:hypothetical protein